MVHLGRFPHTPVITPQALLRTLRGGDIITHAFRGAGGMLDSVARRSPSSATRSTVASCSTSATRAPTSASERRGGCSTRATCPTRSRPTSTSSASTGPVFSFAENMTKMLALGLDLVDVIAMATSNAARAIGRLDEYGSLDIGRPGEISVSRSCAPTARSPCRTATRPIDVAGGRRARRLCARRLVGTTANSRSRRSPPSARRGARRSTTATGEIGSAVTDLLGRSPRRGAHDRPRSRPRGLAELFELFWHPVCTVDELAAVAPRPLAVRLLGRELAIARLDDRLRIVALG
jgi:hypothetical protein